MVVWGKKRRLEKDQITLICSHSIRFLNFRAIWSFLSSSANETNTRQLHFPCIISLHVKTVACKHLHFSSLIHRGKQRTVWDVCDHSEVNDSTKAQQYSLKSQGFCVSFSSGEWGSEWACISFNCCGFRISYSVSHLNERRHVCFIGYLLAEHPGYGTVC